MKVLLSHLRSLGFHIFAEGETIIYRWKGQGTPDPAVAAPLLNELKRNKAEALAQLRIELVQTLFDGEIEEISDQPKPSTEIKTPISWDEETARAAEWFEMVDLPTAPFDLWPWIKITDPVKYRRFLEIDIRLGPSGPRARYGSLQRELRRLYELFGPPQP